MNYRDFNLDDWIGHISGVIEDETTLDGNEMRDLVEFLTTLKQYPTTKNDLVVDAVSRKELLKKYEDRFLELQKLKHLKDNKGAEDRQLGINYCINILKELSSVTPQEPILNKLKEKDEAKTVRYEGDGYADGEMVYDMAFCPNCEHEFEEDSENWECDFCPNCGQKLRWEE